MRSEASAQMRAVAFCVDVRHAELAAKLLGQEAVVFPGGHGGFLGGEFGQAGQPEAFAARLREVLEGGS